jgi:hypothetical protein
MVRKQRRLPLKGKVLVGVGDKVNADTVVARTDIPGIIQSVKVAEVLGLEPAEALAALQVKEGDEVTAGQLFAETKSFFGLIRTECKTPFAGTVELISHATGHVGVRLPSKPIEVSAYVSGTVAEVMEDEGVVVETYGALVQGIFGVGGERMGKLVMGASSPDTFLTEECITQDQAGAVVVGGSGVTLGAIRRAASVGVIGLVVGAIVDTDLVEYLGHDIGVAITGHEDIPTTLILTEGFGSIAMAARTFELLKSLEGRDVSINGATQIRAGVIRPEIIAPLDARPDKVEESAGGQMLDIGTSIRVIREPYFGKLGTVTKLPPELVEIESGAVVRILEAKLNDGADVVVPRANVEIIEG